MLSAHRVTERLDVEHRVPIAVADDRLRLGWQGELVFGRSGRAWAVRGSIDDNSGEPGQAHEREHLPDRVAIEEELPTGLATLDPAIAEAQVTRVEVQLHRVVVDR